MKPTRALLLVAFAVTLSCGNTHQQPLWKLSLQSRPYADPIIDGEKFYVFSQAGEAIAGNINTGEKIWEQRVSGPILGTPVASGDVIFLSTQNGFVYSINKENGTIQWRKHLEDQFIAPLSMTDRAILVPSETGTLYALSRKDGLELWRFSGQKKFNARAVVSGNNIFIGSWEKQFLCLKPDGSVNWRFGAADIVTEDALVLKNNVFFGSYDHFVYALETQTGKLVWRYPASRPSNLTQRNQEIVFASNTDIIHLALQSGMLLRRIKFGKIVSRLYMQDSNLYVVSRDVYRISHSNGTSSVVIRGLQPIYKLTFASGMILALDDLYSIYGYATGED